METDEAYQKKERAALVAIVVLACLALSSLFVAFSYYCYIRNKVSKRHRISKSKLNNLHLFLSLPAFLVLTLSAFA